MDHELIPKRIFRSKPSEISIEWNNDSVNQYNFLDLRDACPCANCIDEWTREKTLDRNSIRKDIDITRIDTVGRYALHFIWNDGHQTGIYPFTLLKELANK
jgi:DUF971 family protein